jgi:hypothetical protein
VFADDNSAMACTSESILRIFCATPLARLILIVITSSSPLPERSASFRLHFFHMCDSCATVAHALCSCPSQLRQQRLAYLSSLVWCHGCAALPFLNALADSFNQAFNISNAIHVTVHVQAVISRWQHVMADNGSIVYESALMVTWRLC